MFDSLTCTNYLLYNYVKVSFDLKNKMKHWILLLSIKLKYFTLELYSTIYSIIIIDFNKYNAYANKSFLDILNKPSVGSRLLAIVINNDSNRS